MPLHELVPEPSDPDTSAPPRMAAAPHRYQDIKQAGILIADDERRDMYLIKTFLQMDGFHCLFIARTTAEVIPLASELFPDLILLDICMPDCSSLDTLRALRSSPKLAAIPVVMMVGNLTSDAKLQVLECGATDLLQKPLHQAELLGRTRNVLAAKIYQDQLSQHSEHLEEKVLARTSELELARREVIHCLARAAEFRDDDTGHHILRVGRYARVIGEEMGLPANTLDILELAAQLHDVGKIGIPDHVLLKPARLSTDEYEVMRKHCGYGKKILQDLQIRETGEVELHPEWGAKIMDIGNSPLLSVAKRIALTHHERWDGTGYPVGLAGTDIPLEGRITAVADVFDALSSRRPYKAPFPLEKCFSILEEGRGSQFDPAVIDAFFVRRDEIIQIQINCADVE